MKIEVTVKEPTSKVSIAINYPNLEEEHWSVHEAIVPKETQNICFFVENRSFRLQFLKRNSFLAVIVLINKEALINIKNLEPIEKKCGGTEKKSQPYHKRRLTKRTKASVRNFSNINQKI